MGLTLCPAPLASLASAVNFMTVPNRYKAMSPNGAILEAFHHRALKLGDPPAFDADHMVMVRAICFELKAGSAVNGPYLGYDAAFLQKMNGAKYGGSANGRVLFFEGRVEFLYA